QGHLLAVVTFGDLLEGRAADEVVIELHSAPIPDVIGSVVEVLDVLRGETAGQRAHPRSGKPLEVLCHTLTREDRRRRRRTPRRLQVRCRIGLGTGPNEVVLLPALENRRTHGIALGPGSEEFEYGLTGHSVAQGAHGVSGDVEVG